MGNGWIGSTPCGRARAVDVDEPTGGVPGLVGVERVDHQRERLPGASPVEPVHALAEDLGRVEVLLRPVARVGGQVGPHARLRPAAAHRRAGGAGPPPPARPVRLGLRRTGTWPSTSSDAVEGRAKAAMHGEQQVGVVGHVPDRPALRRRNSVNISAVAAHRLPAGLGRQLVVLVPAPEGEGALAGHDRAPGRDRGHPLRIGVGEAQGLAGERVHPLRAGPAAVDVVHAQAVHHHHAPRSGLPAAPSPGGIRARRRSRRSTRAARSRQRRRRRP